jgi:hypothetical protein
MRTAQRRHNDEKKLKQRLLMCNNYSRYKGKQVDIPPRAIQKMKNGHRSGWRRHSCRCTWCMEGRIYRSQRGDHIGDWGEGEAYRHLTPKRRKLYYCEDWDTAKKWMVNRYFYE